MIRFYILDKEFNQLVDEALSDRKTIIDKACNLSRKYGGSREKVVSTNTFGCFNVVGFSFSNSDKVDKSLFVKIKHIEGWRPRAVKKNKDLRSQLDKFICDCPSLIVARIIGMCKSKDGFSFSLPGIIKARGRYYLQVSDKYNPKNCKRITDIEYEQATKDS